MAKRKVTLQTIADKAGVSKMTVSLALRDNPGVAERTKKHVKAVARRLKYVPNPLVNAYMAQMRRNRRAPINVNIAYLIASATPPEQWDRSHATQEFYQGAAAQAKKLGYQIDRFWISDPNLSLSRWKGILGSRGFEGVIIQNMGFYRNVFSEFSHLATVGIGHNLFNPTFSFSANDHFSTAFTAHERLIELGYQRIGFVISGRMEKLLNYRFSSGFTAAYKTHKQSKKLPILYVEREEEKKFFAWLKRYQPDVVLSHRNEALAWLKKSGLKIPQNIGFSSTDVNPEKEKTAGIHQHHKRVGAAAVDLVVGQFNRNERGPLDFAKGVTLKGEWVDGNTVRPVS